jgi:hypothetical protein
VALESVGSKGSLDIAITGKNLLDLTRSLSVYTNNADMAYYDTSNSVRITGTAQWGWAFVSYTYLLLPGTYTLSAKTESSTYTQTWIGFSSAIGGSTENSIGFGNSGAVTFVVTEPKYAEIRFHFTGESGTNGAVWDTRYYDIQLERNNIATEYEPFSTQTMTVSTPNGLPGIPVASGGNYTDANGQMWICDEISFARGKYVNRIGRITSYTGETITGSFLSTTGSLTSGATVLYALPSPIEADLSAEELDAYSVLHTNYPQTVIYNDADAWMSVKYVVDVATEADYQDALREMGVDV